APAPILSFLLCLSVAAQQPDHSNAGPCTNSKLPRYQVSANSSGETVEGGVCVEVSPVNRLRNFTFISTTVSQTAGPSPTTIFPSSGNQPISSGVGDKLS